MPPRSLRTALGALVAGVAGACTSPFAECPHQVVDSSTVIQVSPDVACDLETNGRAFSGFASDACRKACNNPSSDTCFPDSAYEQAFSAAQSRDGGAPACPNVAGTVSLTCQSTHYEGTKTSGCPVEGRRPEGLEPARRAAGAPELGAYFAECAHLEAASVIAFLRMRDELALHGAPASLVDAAARAAREEVVHAELTGALARRFGAAPCEVVAAAPDARSLFDFALENAVEGVVRETFGAALALFRAARARDAGVRDAMRAIAEDECGHADLAWQVEAWARTRLSDDENARIDAAKARAFVELAAAHRDDPIAALRDVAGLPSAVEARLLLDGLRLVA